MASSLSSASSSRGRQVESAATDNQPDKRRKLLKLLQEMRGDEKPKKGKTGRPLSVEKAVTMGLRIARDNRVKYQQISSPLGDKKLLTIALPLEKSYRTILKIAKDAFFPQGTNPVLGDVDTYDLSLVNSANLNIEADIPEFTLRKYLTKKNIGGSVRLHLLCASSDLLSDERGDLSLDLPDLDELPDFSRYLNATSSGEVALRCSSPAPSLNPLAVQPGQSDIQQIIPINVAPEQVTNPSTILTPEYLHPGITTVVTSVAVPVQVAPENTPAVVTQMPQVRDC